MAHLTIEERETIQKGLWEKKSLRNIAKELNRNISTISREVGKNLPKERFLYTPRLAHQRALLQRTRRGKRSRLKNDFIEDYVVSKLRIGWSPEQISGRLNSEYPHYSICPESIYQYIYAQFYRNGYGQCIGQDLRRYLRRGHKRKQPKHPYRGQKNNIKNRVFIDERPKEVEQRKTLGHWEGDSLVSRKSLAGLNTLVERVSGLVLISKIKNSTSEETSKTVINRLNILPEPLRKTLTLDNGSENAAHEKISENLDLNCFFAHPYHSWERGTNENTNGLVRWYLPKGTDFAKVSDEEVKFVEYSLNTRPRKRLGWRTPLEVFNQGVALKC